MNYSAMIQNRKSVRAFREKDVPSEAILYRWNDVFDNAEKIRSMVDRLRFQVECFNEALPYEAGQSYGDRAASQVRVIYRIS